MPDNHIVVLGGGVGGVVAVNTLQDRLAAGDRITVVDKSPVHRFKPTFLRLLTGESQRSETIEPLDQFDDGPVSFLNAEVTALDVSDQRVETSEETLAYDYLVVALGAQYDATAIPGIEDAHHVYTADAAEAYRGALEEFQGGDIVLGVSSLPYICPAAPVEAALLTEHFLRKRGIRDETSMRFFFPGPGPMKKAGDDVAEMAITALEERGITYDGNYALEEVDSGALRFENGEAWEYDLLWATPPHRSPDVVAATALADDSGWIPVDERTMETEVENVYAVGDNARVMIPTIGKPLPKAGVFARKQAEVAAHSIANRIHGSGGQHQFDGVGQCFLASQYGLTGKAGVVEVDFFAEPEPQTDVKQPMQSRTWHWGKLLYEKNWHRKWFPANGGGSA